MIVFHSLVNWYQMWEFTQPDPCLFSRLKWTASWMLKVFKLRLGRTLTPISEVTLVDLGVAPRCIFSPWALFSSLWGTGKVFSFPLFWSPSSNQSECCEEGDVIPRQHSWGDGLELELALCQYSADVGTRSQGLIRELHRPYWILCASFTLSISISVK